MGEGVERERESVCVCVYVCVCVQHCGGGGRLMENYSKLPANEPSIRGCKSPVNMPKIKRSFLLKMVCK